MNTMQHEKRGPGRPKKEVERRRRKKHGVQEVGRLGVDHSLLEFDKYAYRWINDEPGRIVNKTKYDDWDLIPNSGEKEDSTDLGAMVSVIVGTMPDGSPKRAFLARKLKTYFDEDRAAAQAALDEQLEQLRNGNTAQGEAQSDYVPRSGISIQA